MRSKSRRQRYIHVFSSSHFLSFWIIKNNNTRTTEITAGNNRLQIYRFNCSSIYITSLITPWFSSNWLFQLTLQYFYLQSLYQNSSRQHSLYYFVFTIYVNSVLFYMSWQSCPTQFHRHNKHWHWNGCQNGYFVKDKEIMILVTFLFSRRAFIFTRCYPKKSSQRHSYL